MGYLFHTMSAGTNVKPAGIVDIPFLGAKVGEFATWTLKRRGDTGQEAALYDLRASFSFVSKALWDDEEYPKRVLVNLSRTVQYRLDQVPGMRTDLQGKSLLIEGVTLCRVQPRVR